MSTQMDKEKIEIAKVILAIIDDGARFIRHEDDTDDVQELRMQLREVAFELLIGREITVGMLESAAARGLMERIDTALGEEVE